MLLLQSQAIYSYLECRPRLERYLRLCGPTAPSTAAKLTDYVSQFLPQNLTIIITITIINTIININISFTITITITDEGQPVFPQNLTITITITITMINDD